jgi:hypothetical protein
MSPHCSAIFLQHSRSADVIAAPGNTQAATGSAASMKARAETPTLINSFNPTSLSTTDSEMQHSGLPMSAVAASVRQSAKCSDRSRKRSAARVSDKRPAEPGVAGVGHIEQRGDRLAWSRLVSDSIENTELQVRRTGFENDVLVGFDQRRPTLLVPGGPADSLEFDIDLEVRTISADERTLQSC